MDSARPTSPQKLLTLQETARQLAVSIDTLLKWNEYHILTPKITLTGEIGYTQEQINQFLTIQHTLQTTESTTTISPSVTSHSHKDIFLKKNLTTLPLRLFGSISLVSSIIFFLVLTSQQNKLLPFFALFTHTYSPSPVMQTAQQNTTTFSTSQKTVLANTNATTLQMEQQGQAIANPPADISDDANKVITFASVGKTNPTASDTTSPLDANGNIVPDNTKPDMLASVLGAGSSLNTSTPQGTNMITNQLLLLGIGCGLGLFVFLKKKRHGVHSPIQKKEITEEEKVMEVNQKMDGTVVLSVQGKEYKISKPELDSDSDRFIERLMQLMQPDLKEVEYESLTDTIKLTTPLSRIVTRLGFVGVKRDLFFPRTSKHRVFFRKYITREDLTAMNLTIEKITDAIVHN